MKSDIGRVCLGGFVATTLVTLLVLFVSPNMTGGPSDLAALMVGLLGASWVAGIAMHFVIGTLIFPVLYAAYLNERLAGSAALRGLTWGALLWLVSQAVIVPATGGGIFSSTAGGLRAVLESLVGHLVYGLAFGVWVGDPHEDASERRPLFHHPEPHVRRAG